MSSRKIKLGSKIYTEHRLRPRDGIRWAVGSKEGRRSSTWRVWGNKKGDTYIATRSVGGKIKISLHKDRRCSVGLTAEYSSLIGNQSKNSSRHWHRWTLPEGEIVKGLEIIIPDSDLTQFESKEKEPMAWIPAPGEGRAMIFRVLIAEPPSSFVWADPEKHGNLLGTMACKTRVSWIVHDNHILDEKTLNKIERNRAQVLERASPRLGDEQSEGLRLTIFGGHADNDLFALELDVPSSPSKTETHAS